MTERSLDLPAGRPYPQRNGRLPRHLQEVTAQWLTQLLQPRYPGVEVLALEPVQVRNGHTTKFRARLTLNDAGQRAGIDQNFTP